MAYYNGLNELLQDTKMVILLGGLIWPIIPLLIGTCVGKCIHKKSHIHYLKLAGIVSIFSISPILIPIILFILGQRELLGAIVCLFTLQSTMCYYLFRYSAFIQPPIRQNKIFTLPYHIRTIRTLSALTITYLFTGTVGFIFLIAFADTNSAGITLLGIALSCIFILIISDEFIKCPNCEQGFFGLNLNQKMNKMACISSAFGVIGSKTLPCIRCGTDFTLTNK